MLHEQVNIRPLETRAPIGSIRLLLYNLLIMIVTCTHSVFFAKMTSMLFEKKIRIGPVIFQESNCHFRGLRTDCQKESCSGAKLVLKNKAYSGKKFKIWACF